MNAMTRVRKCCTRLTQLRARKPKWLHDGHSYAHLLYFAAVFVQGHGVYAYVAGGLLATGLMLVFFRESPDGE